VLYNLHVIRKAVKNLPQDFRKRHGEVPWREIAGMRDFVAHAYFALDLDILWDAISHEVPNLLWQTKAVAEEEQEKHRQPKHMTVPPLLHK